MKDFRKAHVGGARWGQGREMRSEWGPDHGGPVAHGLYLADGKTMGGF